LSVRETSDGKVLVRCFAGCRQNDVIDALRSRGLWRGRSSRAAGACPTRRQGESTSKQKASAKRAALAALLWRSTKPAAGTLVEDYLRRRGITIPVPPALRFHANLRHTSGSRWPGIVAAVVKLGTDDEVLAVHRTLLARDGASKAPVDSQKMMLGPCRGGAVRLAPAGEELMVGEGIETCLAAMQATARPAWAALSTSGVRALELPPEVHEVIVLADGDAAGEAAARHAALRWLHQGRRVRIARPGAGLDFNDLLLGRIASDRGDAA
jgi:hypothetical protein